MTRAVAVALAATVALLAALTAQAAPARPGAGGAQDASPGALVVGLHLPDPGFQVGAVAGSRITYVAGLEADLARALAARLRLGSPSFVQVALDPTGRPVAAAWEIALARIAPRAGGPAVYTAPYLPAGPVVLVRKRLASPRSLADLATVQLCTTAGSRGRGVIASRIRPSMAPLVAPDDERLLALVRTGRCDAAVREAPELAAALDGRPDRVGRVVGVVDTGRSYAVAVARSTGIAPRVDRALAALRATGVVHALATRWLGFDPNRLTRLR